MFVKTLQKLSIPEEKDIIFVSPEHSSWGHLMKKNSTASQKLRNVSKAHKELLKIARDYTEKKLTLSYPKTATENIIVTGHQANWHHCGIFAKNIFRAVCHQESDSISLF